MTGPVRGPGSPPELPQGGDNSGNTPVTPARQQAFARALSALTSPVDQALTAAARTPLSQFALGMAAARLVRLGQAGPLATPQGTAGGGKSNGVVPLNPDRGANAAISPATEGTIQLFSGFRGQDTRSGQRIKVGLGTPAPIPAAYWAAAPNTQLGPKTLPGLSFRQMAEDMQTAIDTSKQRAAELVKTRVIAPLAATAPGQFTVGVLAARFVQQGKPGAVATPLGITASGAANGIVPGNPDRGANAAVSPGTAGMIQILPGGTGFGASAMIPMHYWLAVPEGRFGPQTPVDLSLHPAVARPVQAVGRVLGPPVRLIGHVATITARTSLVLGTGTLTHGALNGTLHTGIFVSGAPNRTTEQKALDRLVNQPEGSVIGAISAKIPFTSESWGMRTTLYAGGILKPADQPYVFPAVLAPGQRGVPPWVSIADGRPRVVSQYNEGWAIAAAGMATGNENFFTNHLLLANFPRINTPIARTDLLPSASRLTPADVQVGTSFMPVGIVALTEYGLGPARAARGVQLGPAVARLMVGTQGASGSALQVGKMDVINFASVAPNPSYNPADPLLRLIQGDQGKMPPR